MTFSLGCEFLKLSLTRSSGFYHDASAGWYYNTNDGVYYKFEQGAYVPIAAMSASGNVVQGVETNGEDSTTESTDFEVKDLRETFSQVSVPSNSLGEVPRELVLRSRSSDGVEISQGDAPNGTGSDPQAEIGSLEVGFPLWYFDSLRSIYWYYDKDTRAYYKYNEGAYDALGETTEGETVVDSEPLQQEHTCMAGILEMTFCGCRKSCHISLLDMNAVFL